MSELRALLRDEKTAIGLANTLGGLIVWVAYIWMVG